MKANKKGITLVLSFSMMLIMACSSNKTVAPWTEDQKSTYAVNCQKFLVERNVDTADATSFSECMLEKTSSKYTFEEATNLTDDQARKLWQECDYQW